MDSLRILLVNPYRLSVADDAPAFPVLGLPILAAVLNKAGHKAEVVDLGAAKKQMKDYPVNSYNIIGFTSLTSNQKGVVESISQLRYMGYKGLVACGGIYATLYPGKMLDWGADLVVTGECEGNITNLFESGATEIQAGKQVSIENIPIPDWEHHTPNITTYSGTVSIIRPKPGITMWTRGCPYSCIFCENKIFNHRPTRYRPPENIAEEMAYLYHKGFHNVFIYDDETVGSKMPDGWMKETADFIHDYNFNLVTQGRCSEKYITDDLMKDAKRAGINTIFWGVESMSQKVLDAMKKHTTIDDITHTLKTARAAGIKNALYFQIGNYLETCEDARETRNMIAKLYKAGLIDYINVFITQVKPGTELGRLAMAEGWYREPPDGWNQMKKVMNGGTPWMNTSEIYYWKRQYRAVAPTVPL